MDFQIANNQYLINKSIIDLTDRYTTFKTNYSLTKSIFLFVPIFKMYKNKNILKETLYFNIRSSEYILDQQDAHDFINGLFIILGKDFKSKSGSYKKISDSLNEIFEYNGQKFIIPKCRSEIYKKYISDDEMFQTILYHSYLNKFSNLGITLDLDITKKIIDFYNFPNNIEITNNYFNSAFLFINVKNPYLKSMNPETDSKFNYLGHAFSDKYLDNSLVLVHLLVYFPLEFLLIENIIPNILKKYKNITFIIIKWSKGLKFIDKISDSNFLKYHGVHQIKFFTYECSTINKESNLSEVFVISNNSKIPDITELFKQIK